MRVIDVRGLGWGAVLIEVEGEELLLVEESLSSDERIEALSDALTLV